MAVSILIRRTVKTQDMAAHLAPLILKLRSEAAGQQGFVTGQTFSSLERDGEYLVLSTWNTLEDWNRWMHSPRRMEIQKKVDTLLGEKTRYQYYEPVEGSIGERVRQA